jgi:hypothetical protein
VKKWMFFLITVFVSNNIYGWYFNYSIMATEVIPPYHFLLPTRIVSVGVQSLGSYFVNLYPDPLDNAFQNPAYLSYSSGNFLYIDMAGENRKRRIAFPLFVISGGLYPTFPHDNTLSSRISFRSYKPSYWEPSEPEPIL